MRTLFQQRIMLTALCVLLLVPAYFSDAAAQKVPISFNEYHKYSGTKDYVEKIARAYPDITELVEIGKSTMGRPIQVLVISNMKTGTTIDKHVTLVNMRKEKGRSVVPMKSYHGKPGHWIDGGTHGNEFTGSEVCLYIIDKLVTGYGSDSEITDLINNNVFYVCPMVNPDGVFNSTEGDIAQRQNTMMKDDDGDGKVNEDGPDDVNGDGHMTYFRYKDPEGRYIQYENDPRVMIRLGRNEETDKERWSLTAEGKDDDGDGKFNEDPVRGIDINRNFPEGWYNDKGKQAGTGDYPSSAPEVHAILEYFTNNTNILNAQSFHTSGGFTYRPFARWPDSKIAKPDLYVYDMVMGRKYIEIIGGEVPESWDKKPKSGKGRGYELPREWRHPYNDDADRPYGFGIFIDWAYAQFGAISMTTELWNWRADTRGVPGYNGEDDRGLWESSVIKYQEDNFGGKWFMPWERYNHPEHGEGEIGGWIAIHRSSNAIPGESLLGICENHWQFELYKAKMLPKLEITDAKAEVLYTSNSARGGNAELSGDTVTIRRDGSRGKYKIVKVTATVANNGVLATHITDGERLAGNREDAVWVVGDQGAVTYLQGNAFQKIGVLKGTGDTGKGEMKPDKRELEWLVSVEGDSPLQVILTSQKGGTVVRELSLK